MTLHIFNPDHDLALATGKTNFTAPHAARSLSRDLGYLPALWAEDGDVVLVENAEYAEKAMLKLLPKIGIGRAEWRKRGITFVESLSEEFVRCRVHSDECRGMIAPWGWNAALRASLLRMGVSKELLPSLDVLDDIRMLSHRRTAKEVLGELRELREPGVLGELGALGELRECRSLEEVQAFVDRRHQVILKAPWSSSGRGIRFIDGFIDGHREGWIKNVIASQGSVMAESYYNKVKDFGMEFHATKEGAIVYEGLSLFSTLNGAYTGNILATERAKEEMMGRYVSKETLEAVKKRMAEVLAPVFRRRYTGPFGIDMMILRGEEGEGFLIHPCVEINLRRTMGHVALALSPADDDIKMVMRVDYNKDKYQLKINKL